MESLAGELDQEVQAMESLAGELDEEVQARESLAGELDKEVQARESFAGELDQEVQARESLAGELDQEVQARESLAEELSNFDNDINQIRTTISQFFSVAFHAVVKSERYPTVNSDEKVKFDSVILNRGGGYNGATGVFTVPNSHAGLYFLSAHIVINDKKWGEFLLKKNDNLLCGFIEDNLAGDRQEGTGSCSVTVVLKAGDQVYVEKNEGSVDQALDCFHNWCGLTGFLMKHT